MPLEFYLGIFVIAGGMIAVGVYGLIRAGRGG